MPNITHTGLSRSWRAIIAALVLSAATPRVALAADDSSRFSLSWARLQGATGCLSARALASRVEERLGRPVFDAPGRATVSIEGHVEQDGDHLHATLSLIDVSGAVLGARELSSADATCRELDGPLVLTVALLIDPDALSNAADAPPRAPPVPPKPTASAPPKSAEALPTPGKAPGPSNPWRSRVEVGGGIVFGLLPEPAPGFVFRTGIAPTPRLALMLDGALWSDEELSPKGAPAPVGFSLVAGGVSICPLLWGGSAFDVRACAGIDGGAISTRGPSDGAILVRHRFFAAGNARLAGAVGLGPVFFLGASAGAIVPLVRDSFDYENQGSRGTLFRVSPVGGTFDVTVGFRAP